MSTGPLWQVLPTCTPLRPSDYVPHQIQFLLMLKNHALNFTLVYIPRAFLVQVFQFCSECFVAASVSATLVSCFLLLRRFDLDVRFFVECFTVCSWMACTTFSLDGSSGGASGHGVRFDGTVTSKGGSIIHLWKQQTNQMECRGKLLC